MPHQKKVYIGAVTRNGRSKVRTVTCNGTPLVPPSQKTFYWGDKSQGTRALVEAITLDLTGVEDAEFATFLLEHIFSGIDKTAPWKLTSDEVATFLRRIDYGLFHIHYDCLMAA